MLLAFAAVVHDCMLQRNTVRPSKHFPKYLSTTYARVCLIRWSFCCLYGNFFMWYTLIRLLHKV